MHGPRRSTFPPSRRPPGPRRRCCRSTRGSAIGTLIAVADGDRTERLGQHRRRCRAVRRRCVVAVDVDQTGDRPGRLGGDRGLDERGQEFRDTDRGRRLSALSGGWSSTRIGPLGRPPSGTTRAARSARSHSTTKRTDGGGDDTTSRNGEFATVPPFVVVDDQQRRRGRGWWTATRRPIGAARCRWRGSIVRHPSDVRRPLEPVPAADRDLVSSPPPRRDRPGRAWSRLPERSRGSRLRRSLRAR